MSGGLFRLPNGEIIWSKDSPYGPIGTYEGKNVFGCSKEAADRADYLQIYTVGGLVLFHPDIHEIKLNDEYIFLPHSYTVFGEKRYVLRFDSVIFFLQEDVSALIE